MNRDDMRSDAAEAIRHAHVREGVELEYVLADAAIAACEPAIRADERRRVLAEVERALDEKANKVSVDDDYWLGVLHGITHSRDHVRSLAASTDSKGDEK